MSAVPPPSSVLRAFGVEASPRLLSGGQGTSWAAGGLVFKQAGGPVHEWLAETLADLATDGIRLASPVPTRHGTWVHEGWAATRWVDGAAPDRFTTAALIDIVEAGRAFHRAVAHLSRPGCLDERQDFWARADRMAWGERTVRFSPELADLAERLRDRLDPLGCPQIVHADLTGNVLFSPGLAPAVIDVSPYWRPPEYAEGVVVADALCWHGAEPSLLELVGVSVEAVARALLFRMATTSERAMAGDGSLDVKDEARRYGLAAAALGL